MTPTEVLEPGWLEVEGTRISQVRAGSPDAAAGPAVATVIPGLVDVHVHGGGGASFADSAHEATLTAVMHHRRRGTTTVCASLMTAPLTALEAQVSHAATSVEAGVLAGLHLEGPWLSPLRAGASAALDAGASQATHLGNGMRPMHHREPGVVLALLERENVVLELINDGIHLHYAVTTALIRSAGRHRVALISDAIPAIGLPDGTYHLGDDDVEVRGREVRQRRSGSLAGSTTSLADSLRRAVRELGVPLADAVAMTTSTPANALALPDVGRLEPGATADLVVLDDDLRVAVVMHRGGWLPA
ncbi:MAG: N-acetylglucosamine-6-phosphate deacetylase [Nocardioidaceae bacterium]